MWVGTKNYWNRCHHKTLEIPPSLWCSSRTPGDLQALLFACSSRWRASMWRAVSMASCGWVSWMPSDGKVESWEAEEDSTAVASRQVSDTWNGSCWWNNRPKRELSYQLQKLKRYCFPLQRPELHLWYAHACKAWDFLQSLESPRKPQSNLQEYQGCPSSSLKHLSKELPDASEWQARKNSG